jgi:hypothetical protein
MPANPTLLALRSLLSRSARGEVGGFKARSGVDGATNCLAMLALRSSTKCSCVWALSLGLESRASIIEWFPWFIIELRLVTSVVDAPATFRESYAEGGGSATSRVRGDGETSEDADAEAEAETEDGSSTADMDS